MEQEGLVVYDQSTSLRGRTGLPALSKTTRSGLGRRHTLVYPRVLSGVICGEAFTPPVRSEDVWRNFGSNPTTIFLMSAPRPRNPACLGGVMKPPAALMLTYHARNLEETKYCYDHLLWYDLAGVVTLYEQDLLERSAARDLIAAILNLKTRGVDGLKLDPALEDIQPNVERELTARLGDDVGGDVSMGRARAELGYVAEHLTLREEILVVLGRLYDLHETLLRVAEEHLETIIPSYTCYQRAEPITLGYYLASFGEELQGHEDRLEASYRRFGVSPAGVGHIVPGPIRMRRERLAELLGFPSSVRHSLYGYLNVDVHIDALAAVALTTATFSRLALDFYALAGSDLRLLSFGEDLTGRSFIMPQKRNPDWLRAIRSASFRIKVLHEEALEIFMHTAPMELGGVIDVPRLLHVALDLLSRNTLLMTAGLSSMKVDKDRAELLAGEDFTQAAEIAGMLVTQAGISWRQAQDIVKAAVREAALSLPHSQGISARRLEEIAADRLGWPIRVDPRELAASKQVREIVMRRGDSGPAPDAVRTAIRDEGVRLDSMMQRRNAEKQRLEEVWQTLEDVARGI
jgi:argininosuccinate lyase